MLLLFGERTEGEIKFYVSYSYRKLKKKISWFMYANKNNKNDTPNSA